MTARRDALAARAPAGGGARDRRRRSASGATAASSRPRSAASTRAWRRSSPRWSGALHGADAWLTSILGKAFARLEAATPAARIGARHRGDRPRHPRVGPRRPRRRDGRHLVARRQRGSRPDAAAAARRGRRVPRRRDRADAARRGDGHRPRFAGHADQPPVLDRRVRIGCSGACSTASASPIDGAGPIADAREWAVDRPAPDPLSRPRDQPAAAARRARARRAADRRRGPARRHLRRLGRRQVDADGTDRAPDRGGRERHRAGRRARPRGGRLPRGVAGRRRGGRAPSSSARPATRPAWSA